MRYYAGLDVSMKETLIMPDGNNTDSFYNHYQCSAAVYMGT